MSDTPPFDVGSDDAINLPPVARSAAANGMPSADPLEADARRGSVPVDILSAHSAASLGGSYLTAEISVSAVRHNTQLIRQAIGPGTKICTVVKANCYGHGLATLLGLLEEGTDWFGVATPEEAIVLRQMGCLKPAIMFLPACGWATGRELRQALDRLIVEDITLTLVDRGEIHAIAEAAKRVGDKARVHIMVDTGMGRGGVPMSEAADLFARVRDEPAIELTGAYTHFATADEGDLEFTRLQLSRFLKIVDAAGPRERLMLHAANSAGMMELPESHLDMVRPGIAVYGYPPSDVLTSAWDLWPAMRLTGQMMHKMIVKAGTRCSYGLTYEFDKDTPVGLVPVGYADGYLRNLSNRSTMRVRGVDVPIRGRVSMDQIIIDLTEVPNANIGEEVEIISNDPASPHSVANLARLAETIPYEITCRLGRRVRRVLVD
jgi:alanine racemase